MDRFGQASDRTHGPSASFSLPAEPSAWWAFLVSILAGLLMVFWKNPDRGPEALLIGAASACLFAASDWISSLHGRSFQGQVPLGDVLSPTGWGFILAGLFCLAWFFHLQSPDHARFWLILLACAGSVTALIFLLRLEWVPVDSRLLALTMQLCTLPALVMGFLAWGEHAPQAWGFWSGPALYFPVSAVFTRLWLRGLYGSRRQLAWVALPLLLLIVASLGVRADLAALLLTVYVFYFVRRLLLRYGDGGGKLPEFASIRRLGREQALWNLGLAAVWLVTVLAW